MATYKITNPSTQETIKVTGNQPPTEAEIDEIFANRKKSSSQTTKPGFFQEGGLLDKASDFVVKNTKDFGALLGDSMAAGAQAKEAERQQGVQAAQNQIIYNKMNQARAAGNQDEYDRLAALLDVDITTINPQELTNELNEKRNQTIKAAVGTATEVPTLIMTAGGLSGAAQPYVANTLGKVTGQGVVLGTGQGFANSDANIINANDQIDTSGVKNATVDSAIGGAIGGATSAALYGIGKGIQKGSQKFKDWSAARKASKLAQNQTQVDAAGEVIAPEKINYKTLSGKEKRALQNEITDFFVDNDISVPRQRGKVLKPEQTLLEVKKHLEAQGLDLRTVDADDLNNMINNITGANGATSKASREIVASIDHNIPVTRVENGTRIDPVSRTLDELIDSTVEIDGDTQLTNATKNKINKILQKAIGEDINSYDPAKLYDAQRTIERLAADQNSIVARSVNNVNPLAEERAKIFSGVADEIANLIDNTAVDDGIFAQYRNQLASFYAENGQTRLSQQVAASQNLSQLRSTSAPFVKLGKIIEEGQAAKFSTFNKNTNLQNRLSGKLSGTVGDIYRTADFLTRGKLDRAASNIADETSRTTSKAINQASVNQSGNGLAALEEFLGNVGIGTSDLITKTTPTAQVAINNAITGQYSPTKKISTKPTNEYERRMKAVREMNNSTKILP